MESPIYLIAAILVSVVCFGLAAILPGGGPSVDEMPPNSAGPPPTDRQLNLIDDLIAERELEPDDWVLEEDPKTVSEASQVIDYLLTLPYRDDLDSLD